jgi:hypothetical protein
MLCTVADCERFADTRIGICATHGGVVAFDLQHARELTMTEGGTWSRRVAEHVSDPPYSHKDMIKLHEAVHLKRKDGDSVSFRLPNGSGWFTKNIQLVGPFQDIMNLKLVVGGATIDSISDDMIPVLQDIWNETCESVIPFHVTSGDMWLPCVKYQDQCVECIMTPGTSPPSGMTVDIYRNVNSQEYKPHAMIITTNGAQICSSSGGYLEGASVEHLYALNNIADLFPALPLVSVYKRLIHRYIPGRFRIVEQVLYSGQTASHLIVPDWIMDVSVQFNCSGEWARLQHKVCKGHRIFSLTPSGGVISRENLGVRLWSLDTVKLRMLCDWDKTGLFNLHLLGANILLADSGIATGGCMGLVFTD